MGYLLAQQSHCVYTISFRKPCIASLEILMIGLGLFDHLTVI